MGVAQPAIERPDGPARRILARCRGEGPPNCEVRCPLGIDARGYVRLTAEGRFDDALRKVRERLPFPGILGRICPGPCEQHCVRLDHDEPLRIRDIKRFLAEREDGPPRHVLDREPERGMRVAVVGAGPAGLLAAHDLRRLGYGVDLFDPGAEPGGCLIGRIPSWRMPRETVRRDLTVLTELGIRIRCRERLGGATPLDALRTRFSAVLVAVGYSGAAAALASGGGLRRTARGTVWADAATCETGVEGVFAAGDAVRGPSTAVDAMAMGRRAADSIHRFLRGEDLRRGRPEVGPRPLRWTLESDEDERCRRVRMPDLLAVPAPPLDDASAMAEADRCLECDCRRCVDACAFLERHAGSPKELVERVLPDPAGHAKILFSCNVCGLCRQACPEGLDTGAFVLEARRVAYREGVAPLAGHGLALSFLRSGTSESYRVAHPEPGRRRSRRVFFPGCALVDDSPRGTLALYDATRGVAPGTGLLQFCCGAPAEMLGWHDEARRIRGRIAALLAELGAEEILTACPDCTATLSGRLPGIRVSSVWEYLDGRWEPPVSRTGVSLALHDPCRARDLPATRAAVRRLVLATGAKIVEPEMTGSDTRCCGLGGLVRSVDPDLSAEIAAIRNSETDRTWLTYCAACRQALSAGAFGAVHVAEFLLDRDWRRTARRGRPARHARYLRRLRLRWAVGRLGPSRSRGRRP